jgi:SAM-dependent methyltransferase
LRAVGLIRMADRQAELSRIRRAYRHYSIDGSERRRRDPGNPGLQAIKQEWRGHLLARLMRAEVSISDSTILDIGCGTGDLLAWFVEQGADPGRCLGIDLMPDRIREATARVAGVRFVCADASTIPAQGDSFHIVCMSLLVSSVLSQDLARRICSEAMRVVTPQGVIVWYDARYPNPANPDVRAVGMRSLRQLFPGFHMELESVSVLPPLARVLGRGAPALYPLLAHLAPLRARYLGLLYPPTRR